MIKKMGICFVICFLMIAAAVPSYGAVKEGTDIGLMALYYTSANTTISISPAGISTATGEITGILGTTTKTTVHLYLQQYKNGKWINIDDWIVSNASVSTFISKSVSVERGYKYRTKASCYAYAGSKSEHVTKYSAEVRY
ncbi:MAG: hypothetical protein ACI4U1_07225 [Anaerovoracaceae bacterium]